MQPRLKKYKEFIEKEYLNSKLLPFTEKDVEKSKDALTEMLHLSDNFAGVPFTHIIKDDGGEIKLKGFTKGEFDEALLTGPVDQPQTSSAIPTDQTTIPAMTTVMSTDQPDVPATLAPTAATGVGEMPVGGPTVDQPVIPPMTTPIADPVLTNPATYSPPSFNQPNQSATNPQTPPSIPDIPSFQK